MDSVLFMILLFPLLIPTSAKSETFSTRLSPLELGLKTEKLTHLHFYFHDTVTGPNPTAVRVAEAAVTNKSSTRFGLVMVIDDPLTVSPEVNSTVVGRAQGIYVGASQSEIAYSMVINFAFTEGKYKGSNLSLLGRKCDPFRRERDADRRRKWGFPIRQRLCSGEDLYFRSKNTELHC